MTRLGDILRSLAGKADGAEGRLDALDEGLSAATSGKVLWEGSLWPNGGQTAKLSERVTAQPHGIVLVYCGYNTDTWDWTNTNISTEYIPKALLLRWFELGFERMSVTTLLLRNSAMIPKTVFVYDNKVVGISANDLSSYNSNGNNVDNRWFALRFVIGV